MTDNSDDFWRILRYCSWRHIGIMVWMESFFNNLDLCSPDVLLHVRRMTVIHALGPDIEVCLGCCFVACVIRWLVSWHYMYINCNRNVARHMCSCGGVSLLVILCSVIYISLSLCSRFHHGTGLNTDLMLMWPTFVDAVRLPHPPAVLQLKQKEWKGKRRSVIVVYVDVCSASLNDVFDCDIHVNFRARIW